MSVRRATAVNGYASTLAAGMDASQTTLQVTDATGLPTVGDFWLASKDEIFRCTSRSGTTCTVDRGRAGTTAASHLSGQGIQSIATAEEIYQRLREAGEIKCLPYGSIRTSAGDTLTASDFTLRNTGTGTGINDGVEGIIRFTSKIHGSNDISGATRQFDTSNDWRITAHLSCPAIEGSGVTSPTPEYFGLGSRQNTGGQIHAIWLRPGRADPAVTNWGKVRVDNRSSFTTGFTSDATSDVCGRRDMWFRMEIEWDVVATTDNFRWYYSFDGVHWVLLHTHSYTSSTCQVGVWMNNDLGPAYKRVFINSWYEEALTF